MRRAALLPLGLLCGALAYGAGYLLVARAAPPLGRGILKSAAELSGCGAMYRLDGPAHQERSNYEKTGQAV